MSRILFVAAVSGFLTVAIGAFAAHGLRPRLDAQHLAWMDMGIRFQGWHTLALIGMGVLAGMRPSRLLTAAAGAFAVSILLFSGSLYALALSGDRSVAIVTPFGGGLSLLGWMLLAFYAWRLRSPAPRRSQESERR